jgi:amidophosphoribosyltransferase
LKDTNQMSVLEDVYEKCKSQENLPKEQVVNYVKEVYKPFTAVEISDKISEMLTPKGIRSEVKIVYQTIENLHLACPNHKGDWYFTGNYPTPGGNKVVNKAFINYMEGSSERAY